MASNQIERSHEISRDYILRDARSFSAKARDWIVKPANFRNVMFAYAGICVLLPLLIIPTLPIMFMVVLWHGKHVLGLSLPLRYPAWTKHPDPSLKDQRVKETPKANGIYFLGNERRGTTIEGGDEIWISDSDTRTHRLVMGATGSGKTYTLLSWMLNPLCFGSGFTYCDGKASNDLWFKVFAMASMVWREDDVRVVNYMMGGADPFDRKRKNFARKSNTMNPFGKANHDTINQILGSIMQKAGGDGATWQSKAINMMNSVTQSSCYLRSIGEIQVSVKTLRENMALQNIMDTVKRTDLPASAVEPLRQYLSVGVPGFNWDAMRAGKPQAQTVLDQHGYLTGQFTRTLGMLGDTYGHIFNDPLPEVDMLDVVLNNRICVVMIPTLEKSPEEAANLGKIVVASAKQMMGINLGDAVEGTIEEAVENRATNYHRPYEIVLDELGYYFADGIDLMFAQARSLMLALTASGQDFQAMAKSNREQVDSMIANTHLKVALKIEDPKETFEVFEKSAGEAAVAQTRGFDEDGSGLSADTAAGIESRRRLTLDEVRNFDPGSGAILYRNKLIRSDMLNMFTDFKLDPKQHVRINTMLPINQPEIGSIAAKCRTEKISRTSQMRVILKSGKPPVYPYCGSMSVAEAVRSAASRIPVTMPAAERGIVLFMAAKRALDAQKTVLESEGDSAGEYVETLPSSVTDDPLSFLDDPPITISNSDDSMKKKVNTPLQIDDEVFGDDAVAAVDDGSGDDHDLHDKADKPVAVAPADAPADALDDEEFGIIPGEQPASVDLKPKTRAMLRVLAQEVSGEPLTESEVDREVNSVRNIVDSVCSFEAADIGRDKSPTALDAFEDLSSTFDSMQDMLK